MATISIHALAWRATRGITMKSHINKISIHALAWRATLYIFKQWKGYGFQSTPSHGGRQCQVSMPICRDRISIHALAWRATCNTSVTKCNTENFNPRPRMEGDQSAEHFRRLDDISIHALAWRATNFQKGLNYDNLQFQSTPSHGGRLVVILIQEFS